ncbi:hypothetical protein T02_5276 [Trichinella nativa]|uniref:Uncharacterized protein n=1 Tax=Trichinella nativa TaxID=6335 RepID=A0A0V1L940_9BILA|nr:hypothetical protein T02_5276 [Trichinella nativa]
MAEPLSCVLYQIVAAFVTAWDKQGCKGAVSTNLDVPTWITTWHTNRKKATLKKRTAEVTKSIPEIYDEEVAAASVEPSTAGQYPVFKQGMKSELLATNIAWAKTVHSRFYQNGINNCSLAMPLQWGCYFHFCQAVHRKVGELGLETRYQTEEETKIKMHLATAFIPVPQGAHSYQELGQFMKPDMTFTRFLLSRVCQPSEWLLVLIFTLCTFQNGSLSSVIHSYQ